MLHNRLLAMFALLFLSVAVPANAQDLLSPAEEWSVRLLDDGCQARRVFGSGDEAIEMRIEQLYSDGAPTLYFLGDKLSNPYGALLKLQFSEQGEAHERIEAVYIGSRSRSGRAAVVTYGVPVPERADEVRVFGPVRKFRLDLGEMTPVLKDLGSCADGIRFRMQVVKLSAGAEMVNLEEMRSRMGGAFGPLYQGEVNARVYVDENGKARRCQIVDAKMDIPVAGGVCLVMLRSAVFEPARDTSGEPVGSLFDIRWFLGDMARQLHRRERDRETE